MAIAIPGKTRCSICGTIINTEDAVVAFSPFVVNEADRLFQFNDAAFHANCFHQHPLAEDCRAAYEETRRRFQPEFRNCLICATEIRQPEEYFTLGLLTSDFDSSLADFNWWRAHRSCLADWEELPRLHAMLDTARRQGQVRGRGIDRLLDQLAEFLLKASHR